MPRCTECGKGADDDTLMDGLCPACARAAEDDEDTVDAAGDEG